MQARPRRRAQILNGMGWDSKSVGRRRVKAVQVCGEKPVILGGADGRGDWNSEARLDTELLLWKSCSHCRTFKC